MEDVMQKTELQEQQVTLRDVARAIGRWDLATKLFVLSLIVLYVPVIREAAKLWFDDESRAQGVFIFPISIIILWLQRDEIAKVQKNPKASGLLLIGAGLLAEALAWHMQIKCLGVWSLIPVIAGAVLISHGPSLWKVIWFPICFLFFAGGLPSNLVDPLNQWLQQQSTNGAVIISETVGIPVIQAGNLISIPGSTLEVADVCSGFQKTVAFIAFALLYAYLYRLKNGKLALFIFAAIPIALAANIVRISALVAVTWMFGDHAFEMAHNPAEVFVVIVAFFLFIWLGRKLGCRETRFSR
jgi:exosortase